MKKAFSEFFRTITEAMTMLRPYLSSVRKAGEAIEEAIDTEIALAKAERAKLLAD